MATTRPVVTVFDAENASEKKGTILMPEVMTCPIRPDLVRFVHTSMSKNKRQAIGVMTGKTEAGYDTASISWGTGRAVARIPRVPGGGTHRSGQGAFGNMCRGGSMFAPNKIWRKWHRRINITQKRHALVSCIAATTVPALVMARGHHINEVQELPLCIDDAAEKINKTRVAIDMLKKLGCEEELNKVNKSKKVKCGRGKLRNRRYQMRLGPLVIYNEDEGLSRALRNIPGVDSCCVTRLNLLQLAPGGTFGRFVIWTESAMRKLNELYGSYRKPSLLKKNYHLPRAMMTNTDLARIINSEEVQAVVRPAGETKHKKSQKKNPLKNRSVLGRLMPGEIQRKKRRSRETVEGSVEHKLLQKKKAQLRLVKKKNNKLGKQFYRKMMKSFEPAVETKEADEVEE